MISSILARHRRKISVFRAPQTIFPLFLVTFPKNLENLSIFFEVDLTNFRRNEKNTDGRRSSRDLATRRSEHLVFLPRFPDDDLAKPDDTQMTPRWQPDVNQMNLHDSVQQNIVPKPVSWSVLVLSASIVMDSVSQVGPGHLGDIWARPDVPDDTQMTQMTPRYPDVKPDVQNAWSALHMSPQFSRFLWKFSNYFEYIINENQELFL